MTNVKIHPEVNQDFVNYFAKIVIIGNARVGKTSLRKSYMGESFSKSYLPTLGADFTSKRLPLSDGSIMNLQIWDLAGHSSFKNLRKKFFKDAKGGLVVFDLTDEPSFKDVMNWLDEMWDVVPRNIPILIIGNKLDLKNQRVINDDDVTHLIKQIINKGVPDSHLDYLTTSAKFGNNVEASFVRLAKLIVKNVTSNS